MDELGMDISNTGPSFEDQMCPCEACNGEYRDSEMCQGCSKYDMEGNEI